MGEDPSAATAARRCPLLSGMCCRTRCRIASDAGSVCRPPGLCRLSHREPSPQRPGTKRSTPLDAHSPVRGGRASRLAPDLRPDLRYDWPWFTRDHGRHPVNRSLKDAIRLPKKAKHACRRCRGHEPKKMGPIPSSRVGLLAPAATQGLATACLLRRQALRFARPGLCWLCVPERSAQRTIEPTAQAATQGPGGQPTQGASGLRGPAAQEARGARGI